MVCATLSTHASIHTDSFWLVFRRGLSGVLHGHNSFVALWAVSASQFTVDEVNNVQANGKFKMSISLLQIRL